VCRRTYTPRAAHQRACSLACYTRLWRHEKGRSPTMPTKPFTPTIQECAAPNCRNIIRTRSINHKYCSNRCAQRGLRDAKYQPPAERRPLIPCVVCGTPFKPGKNITEAKHAPRYCSGRCRMAARWSRKTGLPPIIFKPRTKVCENPACGAAFEPHNSRQRYCSPRCGERHRDALRALAIPTTPTVTPTPLRCHACHAPLLPSVT